MRCSALTDMANVPSFTGTSVVLDAEKLTVDEVRGMTDSPVVRYVINSADALKPACVSALLHIVEEGSASFVFVCRNVSRISPALRSRCVRSSGDVPKFVSTTDLFASMPQDIAAVVRQVLGLDVEARFSVYKEKTPGRGVYRGLLAAYANRALFADVLAGRWARVEHMLFSEVPFSKYSLWYVLGGKR